MAALNPKDILDLIDILITPSKSHTEDAASTFTDTLSANILSLEQNLTKLKYTDIKHRIQETVRKHTNMRDRFCSCCLYLLEYLYEALESVSKSEPPENSSESESTKMGSKKWVNPKPADDVLSIGQQKSVQSLVQFVVVFGIIPNLLPGVGIPLRRRSQAASYLKDSDMKLETVESVCIFRLFDVIKTLIQCSKHSSIGGLILSRHLGDIVASLLQICYGPKPKQDAARQIKMEKESNQSDSGSQRMNRKSEFQNSNSVEENECEKDSEIECKEDTKTECKDGSGIECAEDSRIEYKRSTKTDCSGDSPAEYRKDSRIEHRDISDIVTESEVLLGQLLDQVYEPMLVREILVLQAGVPQQKQKKSSSPLWLRKACGQLLSSVVMRPGGVQTVVKAILHGTDHGNWQRWDMVGKILASGPPLKRIPLDKYYQVMAPQLMDLLNHDRDKVPKSYLHIVSSTVVHMADAQPELMKMYMMKPLMKTMDICNDSTVSQSSPHGYCVVDEPTLVKTIQNIHRVFLLCTNQVLVKYLQPVIHTVFNLYSFCQTGVSHLRPVCKDLLDYFLTHTDYAMAALDLWTFDTVPSSLLSSSPDMPPDPVDYTDDWKTMASGLKFVAGPTGGAEVIVSHQQEEGWEWEVMSNKITAIIELVTTTKDKDLPGNFFIHLLQKLTSIISSKAEQSGDPCQAGKELLEIEDRLAGEYSALLQNLMLLQLLSAMAETLGPECLKTTKHTLKFIKVTLEREVHIFQQDVGDVTIFDKESLHMALGLLTLVLSGGVELKSEDRDYLMQFLPLLEMIGSKHPDSSIQQLATDLRISIATRGAVWMGSKDASFPKDMASKMKDIKKGGSVSESEKAENVNQLTGIAKQQEKDDTDKEQRLGNDLDVAAEKLQYKEHDNEQASASDRHLNVSSNVAKQHHEETIKHEKDKDKQPKTSSESTNFETDSHEYLDFNEAFEQLLDPLVPVRGHAIIMLTKLIQQRHIKAEEKWETLAKIFIEQLDHDDTYIYLSAIQALGAIVERHADDILPTLVTKYTDLDQKSTEFRVKLGEVLVKATRCLGELVPKHRDLLLPCFLLGARDADYLVRASSVSNIGEVCRLLRYSLGRYINEIFTCCRALGKSDRHVEVRRACVVLLRQLLEGLGQDVFRVLPETLRDIYHLLKHFLHVEQDDVLVLHTQLALEEVDRIMKEYLLPKQTLVKKIHVLDPPS